MRLAELRSTVTRLERTYAALRSTEGNPHHDAEGKFTSAGGEGQHHGPGKHHARRQRRKARRRKELREIHQGFHEQIKEMRVDHKQRRRDWLKSENRERRELAREHDKERRKQTRTHERERAAKTREHAKERARFEKKWAGGREVVEKLRAKKAAKLDQIEKRPKHPLVKEVPALRERLTKQAEAKLKRLDKLPERLEKHQARELRAMEHRQRGEIREQKQEHREARKDLRQTHLEERQNIREEQREEKADLVLNMRLTLEDEGFRRPGGGKPSEKPAKRRKKAVADGSQAMDASRFGPPGDSGDNGLVRGESPGVNRAFSSYKTSKASSAEAILKHCLRQRGWSVAFRRSELSGKQQLDLLQDIREYARAWMRHEAEALFRQYGHDDSDPLRSTPLGSLDRGLAADAAAHVTRWFRRARQFIHESIVAGAMALGGGEPLSARDLEEADQQAGIQAVYLDRFARDVGLRTPAELAEPTETAIPPMTAAQFIARAEQYGDAPHAGAQAVERARMIRGRVYVEERRVHGRILDDMCQTCRDAVRRGWVPIGTLPPIGDSECIGQCHCFYQWRDADGNVAKSVRKSKGKGLAGRMKRRPAVEERSGPGNPYHDEQGHFTNPSGVGHAVKKKHKKRKSRKHKEGSLRHRQQEARHELGRRQRRERVEHSGKDLSVKHRAERDQMLASQRDERREHRKAREEAKAPKPARDLASADPKDVEAHHNAMSADWKKSLPGTERASLEKYTGQYFEDVNSLARKGKLAKDEVSEADAKRIMADTDKALARAALAEDTVVYRGVGDLKKLGITEKNAVGATVRDKGFLSTSLTPKIADGFTQGKNSAIIKIKAPKGSPGASVAGITMIPREREVLFARNSALKITGITKEGGRTMIEAELSHPAPEAMRSLPAPKDEVKPVDRSREEVKFGWDEDDVEVEFGG